MLVLYNIYRQKIKQNYKIHGLLNDSEQIKYMLDGEMIDRVIMNLIIIIYVNLIAFFFLYSIIDLFIYIVIFFIITLFIILFLYFDYKR